MSSSAKRALKILATVGASGRSMGVTEIARALAIPPGTAFRGLDALSSANLLVRDARTTRFTLGAAALGLRQSLLAQFSIREAAMPYLRQLASATGEPTSLHVRVGWYAACVAKVHGSAEMTSGVSQSGLLPLSTHTAGRAILAHLPRGQIDRYRAWARVRGIVISAQLERELGAARTRGYAGSSPPESSGLGYPIRKADQAFAAIMTETIQPQENPAGPEGQEIARAIEAMVRANPALAHQPFAHFDPDEVELPS